MDCGKIASQIGHAYIGAFQDSQGTPEHLAYAQLKPGTKIALQGSLAELGHALEKAKTHGIPHFLVIDSGCENFFSGQPTITALGLGPATHKQINNITRRFKLL